MNKLKLQNQVCFPVYALAKEIVNRYRPLLQEFDLTYPQYLVMLVLWENGSQSVSDIGEKLYLDSGTLTPLLKRLEQKGIINRSRSERDERSVVISLTRVGEQLQQKAKNIPDKMVDTLSISKEELLLLKKSIDQVLANLK
ncbi:MAG: MarR family transcriptional regulator [Sphingobacterium sp.]|jgi:DNA-binding MarR family transcriptional regulator|nr:MarR family transcriptional regulator [Sphingobacterium sp.]